METTFIRSAVDAHVILCGLGHVGVRIVDLLARLGCRGVVVTTTTSPEWQRTAPSAFSVMQGDARDTTLLGQAGVEHADAVFVVTNDDLVNVSIALEVRRLNATAVIVARMYDLDLAGQMEGSSGINRLLSASALASPAFVAAALGENIRGTFSTDDRLFRVEEERVPANAAGVSLAQWSARADLNVLALHGNDGLLFHPVGTTTLQPGDRVTCLRSTARGVTAVASRRRRTGPIAMGLALREWWNGAPRPLRATLLALLTIVVFSVGLFHVCLGLSLVDAFYFVVTTITTVGYGDINLLGAPAWLKVYGAFVMVCGAAIIAVLFGIVTDLILKSRLRGIVARSCAADTGHIIVAGLDNIGLRLVRELTRSGESVVVVEPPGNDAVAQAASEYSAVVRGNVRAPETLRRAGVAGARALIAATDDQLANLSLAIATKRAHPACRVVVRLFDSRIADSLQGNGADTALSVSAASAPSFVGAAFARGSFGGLVLGHSLLVLFCRTVGLDHFVTELADERVLLMRSVGAPDFQIVAPDVPLEHGTVVIGCRILPLTVSRPVV